MHFMKREKHLKSCSQKKEMNRKVSGELFKKWNFFEKVEWATEQQACTCLWVISTWNEAIYSESAWAWLVNYLETAWWRKAHMSLVHWQEHNHSIWDALLNVDIFLWCKEKVPLTDWLRLKPLLSKMRSHMLQTFKVNCFLTYNSGAEALKPHEATSIPSSERVAILSAAQTCSESSSWSDPTPSYSSPCSSWLLLPAFKGE